jgi:Superinfection immunity protein
MRGLLTIGAAVGFVAWAHSASASTGGDGGFLAALAVGYMLPTLVAFMRRHPGILMIFVMNLFLGWTFLGWVSALIQACVPIYKSIPISVVNQGNTNNNNHNNTGGIAGW